MCGIVGYIGAKEPVEVLIEGLRKLEYRGYDSAGIALREADGTLMAPVDRPERFGPGEALDVPSLVRDLNSSGRTAFAEPGPDAIVARLSKTAKSGDVIAVFSSGGFGGGASDHAASRSNDVNATRYRPPSISSIGQASGSRE